MRSGLRWLGLLCALWLCACGDDAAEGSGTDGQPGGEDTGASGAGDGDGDEGARSSGDGVGSTGDGDGASGATGAGRQDAGIGGADAGAGAGEPMPSGPCTACDGACMEELAVDSVAHVTGPVDYPDRPPVGGPHDPCWADYRSYADPPLPVERWVHNLEHGAVVFLYHCTEPCPDERAALEALVEALPRTLVTPYDDMPEGFAAVAWGRRLVASCLDLEAMRAFYDEAFDRAPESVDSDAPASCP